MPTYEFRCENCGNRFALFYKSTSAYSEATPSCPKCQSTELARLITGVALQAVNRDYSRMSSDEMLSVLESGDAKQVGKMYQQIGGANPGLANEYQQTTQRLIQGEGMESIERSLKEEGESKQAAKDKKTKNNKP
jgi:putative FmdB family regulatory protein